MCRIHNLNTTHKWRTKNTWTIAKTTNEENTAKYLLGNWHEQHCINIQNLCPAQLHSLAKAHIASPPKLGWRTKKKQKK
jgi:hypothetical protein